MKKILFLLAFSACAVLMNGCLDEDTGEDPVVSGLANLVLACDLNTIGSNVSCLVPVTPEELDGRQAAMSRGFEVYANAYVESYNGWLFHLPVWNESTLYRYTREEGGKLVKDKSLALTANAGDMLVNLLFISKNKAYASMATGNKIVVFNPTTMTKTKEIDLTHPSLSFDGEGTPNPFGMIYRDGKVYVGCAELANMPNCWPGAHMIVIDEATDTPLKRIDDERASSASSFNNCMFVDENDDIYILCWGSYGYVPGQKCGLLRIKSGETEFDPDYFLNVTDMTIPGVEGGKVNYILSIHYGGDGKAYTYGWCPKYDTGDMINDKALYTLQIDIHDQTVTALGFPRTNMYSCAIGQVGEQVLFGLTTTLNGSGLFSYDQLTGACSSVPVVNVPGTVMDMAVFD